MSEDRVALIKKLRSKVEKMQTGTGKPHKGSFSLELNGIQELPSIDSTLREIADSLVKLQASQFRSNGGLEKIPGSIDKLVDSLTDQIGIIAKKLSQEKPKNDFVGLENLFKDKIGDLIKALGKGQDEEGQRLAKSLDKLSDQIKDIPLSTDAEKPISVRLSNGKQFYEAITQIFGNNATVPKVTVSGGSQAVPIVHVDGLALPAYNYVSMALSAGNTTETYTFKTGGASGTTVAVVVIVYTDSSRDVLSSVTRTT